MKNYRLLPFLLSCLPFLLNAQYQKGLEALQSQQFQEALGMFQKAGVKTPALEQFGMARYFSTTGNPAFQLDSAYARALAGAKAYRSMPPKKQEDAKKDMGTDTPVKIRREIEKRWFAEVKAQNNIQTLERFLEVAKSAAGEQIDTLVALRNQLVFETAAAQNTRDAWYPLITKYGASLRETNPALLQKAGFRLLELFVKESGWSEQAQFKILYPEANFARDTMLKFVTAASEMAAFGKPDGWESFLRRFSGTEFESLGLDSLSGFILQRGNIAQCERYLKAYPNGPRKDRLWDRMYTAYRAGYPDPAGIQAFAARFPGFPFQERLREDEKTALDFFYQATMRSDSLSRMKRFLQNYPAYPKVDSVWHRYYTVARAGAINPAAVDAFLNDHPEMPADLRKSAIAEKKEWEERLEKQSYERMVAGDLSDLLEYATQQPPRKYSKEAQDKLAERLLSANSERVMCDFLKELPRHPYRQRVLERLYLVSNANKSLQTINAFAEAYPDFDSLRIKVDRAALFTTQVFKSRYSADNWELYSNYIKEFAPSDEAFFLLQKMMFRDFSNSNWKGVEDTLKQYAPLFAQKNTAFQDFYARMQRGELATRKSLLKWADGAEYPGYCPALTGDGKQLYFTNWAMENRTEDVFFTQYADTGWSVPVPVTSLNTSTNNEAVLNISSNGTEMLLFVSGDIYESKKTATGWEKAGLLAGGINSSYWDGDSRYFAKGLIFVSARNGGQDLYISLYGADGVTLQTPFAIGDVINTGGAERMPFLHPDMKTLYFASNGHDGFGGQDIYMSTRLDDTWKNWSKPRNLGLLFNAETDDWNFVVTTDGAGAYSVSSDDLGGDHISYIDLPQSYRPAPVYTFETTVLDAAGKPVDGEVVIQDLETGKIVQIVRPDPVTGAVFIPMSEKKNYRAELRKADIPPVSLNIDFAQDTAKGIVEEPVIIATTEDLKRSGGSILINNLFFETGSFNILPESRFDLDALAKYLKDSNLAIEIQGHTDDVGSAESNQLLSENRAAAVKNYLVSNGCNPEKIQTAGYGESRPAIPNVDEKSRAKNRRVEFRLL